VEILPQFPVLKECEKNCKPGEARLKKVSRSEITQPFLFGLIGSFIFIESLAEGIQDQHNAYPDQVNDR
jgi:hypothetical protein